MSDVPPRRWPRWLAQVVLGIAVAALAVAGVIAVGNAARQSILPRDRYLLPFHAIECPAPPGQDPAVFLDEVQYIGRFPDHVNVLDPSLPERLGEAFARHRRVRQVVRVAVLPPNRVQVELEFRP